LRSLQQIPILKILIVEDERALAESIAAYLKEENYRCEMAHDFHSAMEKTELYDYDCILLDISLPGGSGLAILKLGADDYLPKPFHLSELGARVAAIIRRKSFGGNNNLIFNEITIDTLEKTVSVSQKHLELTRKEYQLLLYFISNKGRVISKNAISEHLWGDETEGDTDIIYTHIKNLRKKLTEAIGTDYIKSIYGMGYKFSDK
jgi:DNA-binding response OmpR family regulator